MQEAIEIINKNIKIVEGELKTAKDRIDTLAELLKEKDGSLSINREQILKQLKQCIFEEENLNLELKIYKQLKNTLYCSQKGIQSL